MSRNEAFSKTFCVNLNVLTWSDTCVAKVSTETASVRVCERVTDRQACNNNVVITPCHVNSPFV